MASSAPVVAGPNSPSVDAERLIQDMRKVFRNGATRDIKWRQEQLRRISLMIKEREQEFYDAIDKDLSRGPFDSYAEVVFLRSSAEDAAKNLATWAKPEKVSTDPINLPGKSEIVPEPYGVVLILAPWNFPFTTSLEPLIGAIAAGNAVVIKPSEVAPACSALLAKIVAQYLDREAIRVVEGGPDVAISLLEQKWDKIFFTGGTEVGRKVALAAARNLTPVTLELGGKNPCYLDATADLPVVTRRIVWGSFLNAGQVCLKPEYILVEESVAEKLVSTMRQTILEFYGPDPSKSADIARIVSDRHWERIVGLISDPKVAPHVIVGGSADRETRYIAPTLLRDVPWDAAIMQEEIFGPVVAIQTVKSLEEALAIINDRPKPLSLYIFSKNQTVIDRMISTTSSGAVVTNDTITHIVNNHLPFGGVGDSGTGAYHGKTSFDCFSHRKAVLKKPTILDVPFRYPPTNQYKKSLMRSLFSLDFFNLILILIGLRKP